MYVNSRGVPAVKISSFQKQSRWRTATILKKNEKKVVIFMHMRLNDKYV